jgi:hypothetical protein
MTTSSIGDFLFDVYGMNDHLITGPIEISIHDRISETMISTGMLEGMLWNPLYRFNRCDTSDPDY